MRFPIRLAWLLLLLVTAGPALAQTPAPPQRPFGQLVELWTRQLDRIATRAEQANLLPVEIDALREQAGDVRTAAAAAANLARGDLADTRKLLAPLEAKPASDAVPESDAVKAERDRLTEQATVSEGRVKQCEVIIARADQLIERLTKLRGEVMLRTLLRRDASPLSRDVWSKLGPELGTSMQALSTATSAWLGAGLQFDGRDLAGLAGWAIITVLLWAGGRFLRRRFGRGEATEPGQRDRTVTAAIDGVGLVLVPILAVWLIGKLLLATMPPSPINILLPELMTRVITFLLVVGLTATALSPYRPAWRILPFTNQSAQQLSLALRRLMAVGLTVDFVYVALTRSGGETDALSAVGALVLATVISLLTLPALANKAWHAAQPEGEERSSMIGGTWWSVARLLLSVAVLSSIVFALLGYATLAAQQRNGDQQAGEVDGVVQLCRERGVAKQCEDDRRQHRDAEQQAGARPPGAADHQRPFLALGLGCVPGAIAQRRQGEQRDDGGQHQGADRRHRVGFAAAARQGNIDEVDREADRHQPAQRLRQFVRALIGEGQDAPRRAMR